jgi:hypothetical protein
MVSSVGSRITGEIAGDPVRQICDQCRPELILVSDLAAQSRVGIGWRSSDPPRREVVRRIGDRARDIGGQIGDQAQKVLSVDRAAGATWLVSATMAPT